MCVIKGIFIFRAIFKENIQRIALLKELTLNEIQKSESIKISHKKIPQFIDQNCSNLAFDVFYYLDLDNKIF